MSLAHFGCACQDSMTAARRWQQFCPNTFREIEHESMHNEDPSAFPKNAELAAEISQYLLTSTRKHGQEKET